MGEASVPEISAKADAFIARWTAREGGAERANYGMFLTELCALIGVDSPDPAGADTERNDYVFERAVRFHSEDDRTSVGRIDLYKKGSFVLEAKQSRLKGGKKEVAGQDDLFSADIADESRGRRGADRAWDVLMLNAKRQAEDYARALPTSHGWPPFVLVADVGHCIEVYADFSGQGKNYTQFPDRQGFRIFMDDLRRDDVRQRLHDIWKEPQTLDPTRIAAKATREIAERLAEVSKALEAKKYPPEEVAHFLMRCLFTMFAEDVRLLPENSFRELLAECRQHPDKFVPLLTDLWRAMNDGEFAASIRTKVLKFNGNLFADARVLPLGREEIGELAEAANKNWREVEPAIFGTLLEQALDPAERRRLGAHYTPRAYVERLVVATIIEPLREDWRNVQATAENLRSSGDGKGAWAAVKAFHDTLCETRVLDPACGTGNFLYVSMELMKKLEGEVLEALLDLGGQEALTGLGGHTVDPHQFLGLELNPRAAAIAELVLWIGYLQAHFRTKGGVPEPPILKKFNNIQGNYNAVLTWDGYPLPQVVSGKETYPNARRPHWPTAEFIVGNPPFIGGNDIRARLGDPYAEALWAAHPHINESADFVMYWWDRASDILSSKQSVLHRFGLVTTNSITQDLSRRVITKCLQRPLSLLLAIPDHPWTKATKDAAAVRIAMTVVIAGKYEGTVLKLVEEKALDTDSPEIAFDTSYGKVNADLTIGTDVRAVFPLLANEGLCSRGIIFLGDGFIVTQSEAAHLKDDNGDQVIRNYVSGRDLTGIRRNLKAIDLDGLDEQGVRAKYPKIYQHLLETVKPIREKNRETYRRENWWLFGRRNTDMRSSIAGTKRYIATVQTSKHRVFSFLDSDVVPDQTVIAIGLPEGFDLGILSSRVHILWTLTQGGTLEDRPRYSTSECFDPFPFPSPGEALKVEIRALAEELDAFRKTRQKEHPDLTLTQMYNVLEKLKAGAAPTEDEERIKNQGLILILKELHEKLDALVFKAYGWPETLSDEEVLARLVALNHERAAEEKRGLVRWLRPEYQIPRFGKPVDKQAAKEEGAQIAVPLDAEKIQKPAFPSDAVERTAAVFAALAASTAPLDAAAIASGFRQGRRVEKQIGSVLTSLARLGHIAIANGGQKFEIRRAA